MSLTVYSADIEGYRSIRSIHTRINNFSVILGKNGCGKTNLFKALQLLQASANGTIIHTIAAEGGLNSVLWAGNEAKQTKIIKLTLVIGTYQYIICIGHPDDNEIALRWSTDQNQMVTSEPVIKSEQLIRLDPEQPTVLMERIGHTILLQQADGSIVPNSEPLLGSESVLHHIQDGVRFPEMERIRESLVNWHFYHHFQADRNALVRQPSHGICTPTLSPDGHNLAALFDTLIHYNHQTHKISEAIESAFPGSNLFIKTHKGKSILSMSFPDMPRPFAAHELSDGTLRFLCLIGALKSLRQPQFIAFNEPEMSLHPDFMKPMAKLLIEASQKSQVWVTTHSIPFVKALQNLGAPPPQYLDLRDGETYLDSQDKAA